jgi:type I restriction enzyme S subunit
MMFYKETNFKETPIGNIPKEWGLVKLESVCEKIKAGGTPFTSKKEYYNGDIPFVKIEDLTNAQKYLKNTLTTITKEGLENSSSWLVPPKSLLFAMYGSIGAMAINEIPVATNQAILAIIPEGKKIDLEFIYYLLSFLKPYFEKHAKQTTQANLTAEIVREFKIPYIPLPEQQRIAEILSTIDEAIRKTDDIIAKTERLKKGLMQELLTKGMGHKEFKDTEIGRIPKEWEVIRIDRLFDLYKGTTPSTKVKEYWNGGIPFVTPTDITKVTDSNEIYLNASESYITEKGLKSKGLWLVPENSLLFTSRATIGYLAINKIKVAINQGIISLVPKDTNVDITFYYYLLQKLKGLFENLAGGSTYKEISMSTFSNINVPLLNLEEQQKIAKSFLTIDKKLELERNEKAKLERIKQELMNLLLTGKIRVRVE